MKKSTLIINAKSYAVANPYKFHVFIETHGTDEWADLVSDCDTIEDVHQLMDDLSSVWGERGA